jgi:hypothetical protein
MEFVETVKFWKCKVFAADASKRLTGLSQSITETFEKESNEGTNVRKKREAPREELVQFSKETSANNGKVVLMANAPPPIAAEQEIKSIVESEAVQRSRNKAPPYRGDVRLTNCTSERVTEVSVWACRTGFDGIGGAMAMGFGDASG